MFSKNNQVYYYNAGRNKSILLESIDARSFIKIGQFTEYPSEKKVRDHPFNPRAGEIDYFYCKDRNGVYFIEEDYDLQANYPQVNIRLLSAIDPKTFLINQDLFPYSKDKNGVYLHTQQIRNLDPQVVNFSSEIDKIAEKAFEVIAQECLYQYP